MVRKLVPPVLREVEDTVSEDLMSPLPKHILNILLILPFQPPNEASGDLVI
jgi:hypothetical protein